MMEKHKATATWSLECTYECPNCGAIIDIVADDPELLDRVNPCENRTPASTDIEAECPDCGTELLITFEY